MPQPIYEQDLKRYQDLIGRDKVQGVIRVYSELLDKGYDYAGWARGVAAGNTVTGEAAILFMQESSGRRFSESELNTIRVDMAYGYLNVLANNMDDTGRTQKDADFDQIRSFHRDVFERHSLKIGNWTLEEPIRLLGKYGNGKETQDQVWNALARTQGDGADAVAASAALYLTVADFADGHIHVDKNGRYLPRPQPATPYNLPVYGQVDGIRSIDAADRSLARRWLADAAQWRSLSKTFAEAQDIAEQQTQLAQHHFGQPVQAAQARALTLDDIPDQAKKLYTQTEDRMRAFYAEFGIPFREHELKNAAAVLAATAYEKKLPEVQDFELHNGKMVAFYESRGGAYKEALLDADFANNMPQQQSFARMIETEPKLEEAARQRALEIAAHEQSRGMGRSV